MQVKHEGTEILKVLCGSRAYGLEDDDSDHDYHGIFVVPTSRILSINSNLKETSWVEGEDQDNTAWEIGHFLKMALHCNPTVLETFVAPVVSTTPLGDELRTLFPHVLSRKYIYDAFRGYASNQRKKMFEPTGTDLEKRSRKAAVAYLRSLLHGEYLLLNGTYNTKIDSAYWIRTLKDIKRGFSGKAVVISLAEELEDGLRKAYGVSAIPLTNNMDVVNEFLLRVRKENW